LCVKILQTKTHAKQKTKKRKQRASNADIKMGKYAQLVMGPAGSGKSTYCHVIQQHCEVKKRTVHVINLDPAAEAFKYTCSLDIRDLISLDDVMEELNLGPNGGLLHCMEYLVDNMDWFRDEIADYADDYVILDCPGQIELYTHVPVMRAICSEFQRLGYHITGVYCVDSTFVDDTAKYISGTMMALSAMTFLEIPHINVLTKCDLLEMNFKRNWKQKRDEREATAHVLAKKAVKQQAKQKKQAQFVQQQDTVDPIKVIESDSIDYDEQMAQYKQKLSEMLEINEEENENDAYNNFLDDYLMPDTEDLVLTKLNGNENEKFKKLNQSIASLLTQFSMVQFVPLNIDDEDSLEYVLSLVDHTLQYGEDEEVKDPDEEKEYNEGNGEDEFGDFGGDSNININDYM